jgi:AcrR family transcriptional regulator
VGSTTRQSILDRSRELFNEQGLESVGVRDLARDLGLSPGNVSYYFAKKEDLIAALMDELASRNTANVADLALAGNLSDLLGRYRSTFEAQYEYRFLARAIVHIVESYPDLAARYRTVEMSRRQGLASVLAAMVGSELRSDTGEETLALVVGTFTLVARFWLSEARISFPSNEPRDLVDHYIAILAHALWSPATADGRRSLLPLLSGILVAPVLGR